MSTETAFLISLYDAAGDFKKANFGPIFHFTFTGTGPTQMSAISDGVTINNPQNLLSEITWNASDNNPSSLQLIKSTGEGVYTIAPSTAQSTTFNLAALSAKQVFHFEDFDGTYKTTNHDKVKQGDLVLSGSHVTFAGNDIKNPLFLEQKDQDSKDTTYMLAWFASDDNSHNVAIAISKDPKDKSTLIFFGYKWGKGDHRPTTEYDFYGTTSEESDATQVVALAIAAAAFTINAGMVVAKAVKAARNKDNDAADDDAADDAADDHAADDNDADDNAGDDAAADAGDDAADAGDAAADAGEAAADAGEVVAEVLIAVAALADPELPDDSLNAPKQRSGSKPSDLLNMKK
ncbi:hypothetical protein [Aquimarina mytili]|uniref:Uncharacterized protein n=1 Tax=Aquimarina mytili TaxID=874423 RepID=A0A937A1J9_9FLAO|nr:hypothetical protein [Aquimarina mytili]MBL0683330.1 hypothetical protein [Aquimarina mytili]